MYIFVFFLFFVFHSDPYPCRTSLSLRACIVAKRLNQYFVHFRDCKNFGVKPNGHVFCGNCSSEVGCVYGEMILLEHVDFISNRSVYSGTKSFCSNRNCLNSACICFAIRSSLSLYNIYRPFAPVDTTSQLLFSPRSFLYDGVINEAEFSCMPVESRKVRRYRVTSENIRRERFEP